ILGKVRPFLRRLAEAHPQVLIIARTQFTIGQSDIFLSSRTWPWGWEHHQHRRTICGPPGHVILVGSRLSLAFSTTRKTQSVALGRQANARDPL
ncbi:hypothetical protein, partial [Mycobacteroides abscessus]